ncbi:TnsD family Tn7-like transposition protein [Psychrobacter sp. I-STPA6b]|uniref:TnsD family Tn7-like transposition protein n=1 Tax=Psychrobacter sp. I-STPA6b TaxID=2585718 RepID=UPI001D0BFA46|nr:TnsD family Tn7-like transposition protein [Psychrobacter sp. I-STPA6b]
MINLPMPYPEELIYSTVARYKIRAGLISPKQLLDDVFEDRGVVATVDFPCHLSKIMSHYSNNLFNLNDIVYQHTLFPLYAPFIPELRRQDCLKWIAGQSQGSIHLSIGSNASRLPPLKYIRFCPQCLNEQFKTHGEWYWSRMWQISGITCCIKHGKLVNSLVRYRPSSRHDFIAPTPQNCIIKQQESISEDDRFLTSKITELLSLTEQTSATFEQWTTFYQNLARTHDCIKGTQQINHACILEKVKKRWSLEFLESNNLNKLDSETGWLRNIFRKHRKSFSYMEHIVAIESLLEKEWSFKTILAQVKSRPSKEYGKIIQTEKTFKSDSNLVEAKRNIWINLIKTSQSIKDTRKSNQALYTWLYRHDKTWLLNTNKKYHTYYTPVGTKVNWYNRDNELVRKLIRINNDTVWDLQVPRKSKRWWIKQIGSVSMIEKNFDKLPLVSAFLNKYCEDVSDYQIRRLSRVLIDSLLDKKALQCWEVLRLAGLSDERISPESSRFLAKAHNIVNNQISKVSI